MSFIRYLKNLSDEHKKNILYFIFSILIYLILSQLWGRALRGADDPYTAVASFNSGGLWLAAWNEAIRQGRFSYVISFFVAQLPYVPENFYVLNSILIITNFIIFILFYKLLASLWGFRLAALVSFIGLAIFDWVGGNFNLFHGSPLWCSVAFIFLLLSLNLFVHSNLSETKTDFISAFLFFLSILFYEIFIFYFLAFVFIFIAKNNFKFNLSALRRFKYFISFISLYLFLYISFRAFYPSNYAGTSHLEFESLERTFKTIETFSFAGLYLNCPILDPRFVLISLLMTLFVITGFVITLSLQPFESNKNENIQSLIKKILSVGLFIFTPNLLYGFISTKHAYADYFGYYVGTYLSSFAIFTCIGFFISFLENQLQNQFIKKLFYSFITGALAVISISNYMNSERIFYFDRVHAAKWPLMNQIALEVSDQLNLNTILCTTNLFEARDSFSHNDYWAIYLSKKIHKRIKLRFSDPSDRACEWIVDYKAIPYTAQLTFLNKKTSQLFSQEMSVPKPLFH